jgi:hypothetical protein
MIRLRTGNSGGTMQDMQDKQEWFFGGAWKLHKTSDVYGSVTRTFSLLSVQARIRRCFTGAASPRKSDGGGAPSLPWGSRWALSRHGAVAPFEKQMVGPPRRRGPKIQARMRRFFTEADCAAQVGRRQRAIPTLGARWALSRRYFKTASLQFC